ncbi:DinB family protein [Fodinibius sp. AD559]|uniref:DinB family protein n=1 Tax=Fodinibius sp. AD559 TaxID=3424179 RepID=UPI004046EF52
MSSFQQDLNALFQRDLNRLIENLRDTPEEMLWKTPEGITNSIGVLAQHLTGNINHFVGEGLGNTGYERDREREFKNILTPKEDLISNIEDLKHTLATIYDDIEDEEIDAEYPMEVPFEATTRGFLIHLYGHLNYHLGQIDYLRRIMSENG